MRLGRCLAGIAAACLYVGPLAAAPHPAIGPDDLALIDAVTWGANASSARRLAELGRARWLAAELRPSPETALPPAVQAAVDATGGAGRPLAPLLAELEDQARAANTNPDPEAKKAAQAAYQAALSDLNRGAQARTILRAVYGPGQLREKMSWFWLNHFNIHSGKANIRAMTGDYLEAAIRPHALGRFRDLLRATARHPAMLRFLDNADNAAGRLNENYGRELLELHTMGVGSGYGQADVEALARILTGAGIWVRADLPKVKPELEGGLVREGAFLFNPARHEPGDKALLGRTIPGAGLGEIDAALDLLAREPATARHVSRRIATYFAGDEPPPALIARMTDAYGRTDGDIAAVLEAMFLSPDFLPARRARFVKDPVAFVLSAVRLAYDDRVILNPAPVQGWMFRLGEGLFDHSTPDGNPLGSGAWTGPGQLTTRFEVARQVGSGPAGLFKAADGTEKPGFPVLQNELYFAAWRHRLAPATRTALDQATSPQDWNTLFLSSPDFMR